MKRVRLLFELEEDVTPQLFALRIAEACAARYALRSGEAIVTGGIRFKIWGIGRKGRYTISQEKA